MNKKYFESNQKYFTICVYTIFVILAGCVIFRLIFHWNSTFSHVMNFISHIYSFVIGILIAFMVNPLVRLIYKKLFLGALSMKRKRVAKVLSILVSYILVLGFITICLVFVIPQLISSISDLSANLPMMYTTFSQWLRKFAYRYDFINNDMVNEFVNTISPKMMEFSTTLASKIIPWLYSVSVAIIKWLVMIIIAIVVSIYLLSDKKRIFHTIKRILFAFLPESIAQAAIEIAKSCNDIFTGYIIAKAIDSLIIGILCFIVMSILQLPYAVLISVIVGITNMIPYFGPYVGAMPGIFILTVVKFRYGLIFAVMILALQQFDGLILGPKLLGDSTGVRPILILFAITVGGAYAGVLGMFLGVPVIAVCQYLLNLLIERRLSDKNISFPEKSEEDFIDL